MSGESEKRLHRCCFTGHRPENMIREIGLMTVFGRDAYSALNADQLAGLESVLELLSEREREMIRLRYEEGRTLQMCGDHFGVSRQRTQQILSKAVKKLRSPSRIAFIREGYAQAELSLMIKSAEKMREIIKVQRERYPLMNEEDVVKLVFQGMLGVGHMIASEEEARKRLHLEMLSLTPVDGEPLTENLSPQWFRLNLRAAKARGVSEDEIAEKLFRSAGRKPLDFTRRNVYSFCVKLDSSDRMKEAAEKVLEEDWLPSHSGQYKDAYHPCYRVLHNSYRKLKLKMPDQ